MAVCTFLLDLNFNRSFSDRHRIIIAIDFTLKTLGCALAKSEDARELLLMWK